MISIMLIVLLDRDYSVTKLFQTPSIAAYSRVLGMSKEILGLQVLYTIIIHNNIIFTPFLKQSLLIFHLSLSQLLRLNLSVSLSEIFFFVKRSEDASNPK